jgi:isopenicillin-N epimerase
MNSLKSRFLLDPGIAFLNHGSFGACPRPVLEACQRYQLEMEREPVDFLQRTFRARMRAARGRLADYLGCSGDDLVFVRNATYGLNTVARSLPLGPGDTVLASDQEYGAVERMWETVCAETGARLVRAEVPFPAPSPDAVVEAFARRIDRSVKVIAFPHIAPMLAQVYPAAELVALARQAGAVSVVDGAHAPGQLPLDLTALGADFYVGNCHKWMLSPKGAAFLHAAEPWAERIRPPVISWGTISEGTSALLLENEWQGTMDISAFLAVADAIDFAADHRWQEEVIPRCSRLLEDAGPALLAVTRGEDAYLHPALRPPQLAAFRLPGCDAAALHSELFHQHRVEVPVVDTAHGTFVRVSVQGYNDSTDLERLAKALAELLPKS